MHFWCHAFLETALLCYGSFFYLDFVKEWVENSPKKGFTFADIAHKSWMYIKCLLVTIADSDLTNEIFGKSWSSCWISNFFFVQSLFLASNLNLWWHILFLQPEKPFSYICLNLLSSSSHRLNSRNLKNQTFH